MLLEELPFARPAEHGHTGDPAGCPTFRMLPDGLQEHAQAQPHLWEYLHVIPLEDIGIPQYYETLTRKEKDLPNPNLIYPVRGGIFIHIYPDESDSRDYYVVIEPGMAENLTELLDEIEIRLVDLVHELDQGDTSLEAREQLLLETLDKICAVKEPSGGNGDGKRSKPAFSGRGRKVGVTDKQMVALRYVLVRDKVGMGPLQPLINDSNIEDISCSGVGPLFVEHKIFDSLKATISFKEHEELDSFVIQMSEKMGKPVTFRDPIVDAVLPDGSRINIVFGGDLSKRGSNFTIRKFMDTPMSVLNLVETGSISYEVAAYLSLVLGEGMNLFVAGETASGKMTLLNAITTFISAAAKIVSIEDTPELQVPHPNWIREVVRGSTKTNSGSAVTMFDLLKAALRQRPNEIIIGEIRGEEGLIAFQAMQTGHACMATFHAASVEKLIQRLTGSPINVPKTYIDNLNVVVIQAAVRLANGKAARRVLSVSEIIGYDSSSDSFSFIEVFRWDPIQDVFEFSGRMNSFLLEQKIAPKRGLPPAQRRDIYNVLDQRVSILKKLKEKKRDDFYDLYRVLAQAARQGLIR